MGSGLAGGAAGGWTTIGCNWCWTWANDWVKAVVNILIVSCKVTGGGTGGTGGGTRGGTGGGTGGGAGGETADHVLVQPNPIEHVGTAGPMPGPAPIESIGSASVEPASNNVLDTRYLHFHQYLNTLILGAYETGYRQILQYRIFLTVQHELAHHGINIKTADVTQWATHHSSISNFRNIKSIYERALAHVVHLNQISSQRPLTKDEAPIRDLLVFLTEGTLQPVSTVQGMGDADNEVVGQLWHLLGVGHCCAWQVRVLFCQYQHTSCECVVIYEMQ